MATGKRRGKTPMMRSITADRLGAALDNNTRGPAQNKRIAQLLGCSPDFAGDLKRGVGWTPQRIDQCIQHFGAVFVQMVFGDMMGPERPYETSAELATLKGKYAALNTRMARLEARVGGDDEVVAPAADLVREEGKARLDGAGGAGAGEGGEVGAAGVALGRPSR